MNTLNRATTATSLNRSGFDNALLTFGCRPIYRRGRRAAEATAWIVAYAIALNALWIGAAAVRAYGLI
ncbi:hypothetical protein [Paraburkholderia tropica]|uniref:hypothetical protein n=1 Tax=Paraburkholderia tropica TaxID=92647 RepID=UPI002AB6B61B|nr:hypothetical protein [Paraburkholderia tropica]